MLLMEEKGTSRLHEGSYEPSDYDVTRPVDMDSWPVCTTVQDFVRQVILDGRFLNVIIEKPDVAARGLKINLDKKVVEELRGKRLSEVLSTATSWMTEDLREREATGYPVAPEGGIGIVAIAVAVIIDRCAPPAGRIDHLCEDLSDDADQKL